MTTRVHCGFALRTCWMSEGIELNQRPHDTHDLSGVARRHADTDNQRVTCARMRQKQLRHIYLGSSLFASGRSFLYLSVSSWYFPFSKSFATFFAASHWFAFIFPFAFVDLTPAYFFGLHIHSHEKGMKDRNVSGHQVFVFALRVKFKLYLNNSSRTQTSA